MKAKKHRIRFDKGEPVVLSQKFQQRQQVRVCLDLVNEDQGVFLLLHLAAFQHADLQVEILHGLGFGKEAGTEGVLHPVDLDVVFEELLAHMADDIGFAYLTGSVDEQNLFGIAFQMLLDEGFDFTIQHG